MLAPAAPELEMTFLSSRGTERLALWDGRAVPRIPYFPLPWGDLDAPCGDCSVTSGMLHRLGCAIELCPDCGDQLAGCRCAA